MGLDNILGDGGITSFLHMNQAAFLTGASNYALNYWFNYELVNYPTVVPFINLPLSAGVYMALIAAASVMPGIAVGSQAGSFISTWVDLGSQANTIEGAAGAAAVQIAAWEFINPTVIDFQGGLPWAGAIAAGSFVIGEQLTKMFPLGA